MKIRWGATVTTVVVACSIGVSVIGQAGVGQPQGGAQTAKAAAPIDLTGYWVSVITQDWRWRMVTPARGDYSSVPITLAAKKIGDAWDPAKDEAAGEQCRAYGAAAIMSLPTRLHITWQDDNTLNVATDAGEQTRVLHFGNYKPASGMPTWQGETVAAWEGGRGGRGAAARGGSLKTVTTSLRPGYLRKNGVPYSKDAVVTEFWDLGSEKNGDQWITITSQVEDPTYLRNPYITALHFKKERDGAKWDPSPCSVR